MRLAAYGRLAVSLLFDVRHRLDKMEKHMLNASEVIASLRAEVEAERDENAAAVVLIQSLAAEIRVAATQGDLQGVQDLTQQLHANAQALADAIKSNSASGQPNVAPAASPTTPDAQTAGTPAQVSGQLADAAGLGAGPGVGAAQDQVTASHSILTNG